MSLSRSMPRLSMSLTAQQHRTSCKAECQLNCCWLLMRLGLLQSTCMQDSCFMSLHSVCVSVSVCQLRVLLAAYLAIITKEHPAAFRVQGSKLFEAAQLPICQGSIELCVECSGIVPGRPATTTPCSLRVCVSVNFRLTSFHTFHRLSYALYLPCNRYTLMAGLCHLHNLGV